MSLTLLTLMACQTFRPEPVHVEVLHAPQPVEEQITEADLGLLGRLRPHIRRQVQEEMIAALENPPAEGVGGAFAVRLWEALKAAVKKLVDLVIVGAVFEVAWHYAGHIFVAVGGVAGVIAWLVSRRK